MNSLFIIPARGGSKGIPGKNIKVFNGKPLIHYAIDVAREFADDSDICVSTDDEKIKLVAESYHLKVPFLRPKDLAKDNSGMYEVLLHALEFYESNGNKYECVILLQPTSPFRKAHHIKEALQVYLPDLDMVVSVKEATSNPYFKLYEEDQNGYLRKFSSTEINSRQEAPKVWDLNGAIFIYNIKSLKREAPSSFLKVKKYEMSQIESIDLDTELDWLFAEFLIKKKLHE